MTARPGREWFCNSQLRRGFSLAELLVVVGIISLLIAIVLPPLRLARAQAQDTQCRAQLRELGSALTAMNTEFKFYPYWDDRGSPTRFTWIDVLAQNSYIGARAASGMAESRLGGAINIAYCPSDLLPDPLNAARYPDLIYPLTKTSGGIDYSYGIGVPLSAGGWAWVGSGPQNRLFRGYKDDPANRVLAGDAVASMIWNLSGNALNSSVWNDPTQFDNDVAWGRHRNAKTGPGAANLLFQDQHVKGLRFDPTAQQGINTATTFVWQRGESIYSNPDSQSVTDPGFYYPYQTPPSYMSVPPGSTMPEEVFPAWYTNNHHWTQIPLKN